MNSFNFYRNTNITMILPNDDLEDGMDVTRMTPPEVQSVLSETSKTLEESGSTTPMSPPPPNRCWNAMKFFSFPRACFPCIIAVAAFCVHNDIWRIFNIVVLCIFCCFYVLSANTLLGGKWLSILCSDEELNAHLEYMRESRMELQIHIKCSHTNVWQERITVTIRDDDGGSREEDRLETYTEHIVTHEETIDFEYGACLDKSPHSVNYGGFNMCGLVFNGMYEWGDPDIALRHKLAVQQAHEDFAHRDKELSVVSTFKIPPMLPCSITSDTGEPMNWWFLAFLTGLVAFYDCWIGSAAGFAVMDIRKVLCTKAIVSGNLDTETSSHRVVLAKPMADYAGDSWESINPSDIAEDKNMCFISIVRDLKVDQEVVVKWKAIKDVVTHRPRFFGDDVLGKIAKVLPNDGPDDINRWYSVELYAESDDTENTTSGAIDGTDVRAFHKSAVVTHVGDRNYLSDVKLACLHCHEIRAMEGFKFCGACGEIQKRG